MRADDLWPILMPVTDEETGEIARWLREHEDDKMPRPLASLQLVCEYKDAHIRRAQQSWKIEVVEAPPKGWWKWWKR